MTRQSPVKKGTGKKMGKMMNVTDRVEPKKSGINRRELLKKVWWASLGLLSLEMAGALVASLQPRAKAGAFGSKISIGTIYEIKNLPVGTIRYYDGGRFYLSRLENGVLALYRKCTHLGCVVPWIPEEQSEDNLAAAGRFNCPCHASIFDRYGRVHAGPAPRPLDLFKVTLEGNQVFVDTGIPVQRAIFEPSQVTKV